MEGPQARSERIFIGHGGSPIWRELKDFLRERLGLQWEEFNRESVAGRSTTERLQEMIDRAAFAFLVMTAEEEHGDGLTHARMNVAHELGLFQGRLGFRKAIILLEDGCAEFSNIVGLSQIRFPKGRIGAAFEDVRQVLERARYLFTTATYPIPLSTVFTQSYLQGGVCTNAAQTMGAYPVTLVEDLAAKFSEPFTVK